MFLCKGVLAELTYSPPRHPVTPLAASQDWQWCSLFESVLPRRVLQDYLIAEGYNSGYVKGQKTTFDNQWFYSQDGVKWVDLPAVDAPTAERAIKLRTLLTGDSANETTIEEADPAAADLPPPAEGEEGPPKLTFIITELQRLRVLVDAIAGATSIMPKGCLILDDKNRLVPNKLWSGADYPEKLEVRDAT